MDGLSITIVMLTFLLAGGVKGVVGLGLPTVSVALLSAAFGIEAALPLLVIPSFVTNVWQGAVGGNAMALLRRFGIALAIIPVATWIGYHFIFVEAPQAMDRALGVALLVYAGARSAGDPPSGAGAGGACADAGRRSRQRTDHRRDRDLRDPHRDVPGSTRSRS